MGFCVSRAPSSIAAAACCRASIAAFAFLLNPFLGRYEFQAKTAFLSKTGMSRSERLYQQLAHVPRPPRGIALFDLADVGVLRVAFGER